MINSFQRASDPDHRLHDLCPSVDSDSVPRNQNTYALVADPSKLTCTRTCHSPTGFAIGSIDIDYADVPDDYLQEPRMTVADFVFQSLRSGTVLSSARRTKCLWQTYAGRICSAPETVCKGRIYRYCRTKEHLVGVDRLSSLRATSLYTRSPASFWRHCGAVLTLLQRPHSLPSRLARLGHRSLHSPICQKSSEALSYVSP
jgi:hypothetical protein